MQAVNNKAIKEEIQQLEIKNNTVIIDGFELNNTLGYMVEQEAIDEYAVLTVKMLVSFGSKKGGESGGN